MNNNEVSRAQKRQLSLAPRFNELRTRVIMVPEWKVLLALAYDGPKTMFDLSKFLDMAYPAVHKATKCLEQLKWVKIIRRGMSVKNVPTKVYGLTKEGLLWMFSRLSDPVTISHSRTMRRSHAKSETMMALRDLKRQKDFDSYLRENFDMDKIAKTNSDLIPHVLAHWDFFEEIDVADDLFRNLSQAAMSTLCDYHFSSDLRKSSSLENLFTYNLYYAFIQSENKSYALDFPLRDEARERAVRVYREGKDPLLQNTLVKIVRDLDRELSRELKSIKSFAKLCDL